MGDSRYSATPEERGVPERFRRLPRPIRIADTFPSVPVEPPNPVDQTGEAEYDKMLQIARR